MKLICINSNSSGNGYILTHGEQSLILELGCNWKDYERALNYYTGGIVAAISSHV